MEKKNPSVWQFEHFSEVSGRKSDGLRSPGPFAFGENLRDSAPASKRGNQFFLDRILVQEQSQIKISIWSRPILIIQTSQTTQSSLGWGLVKSFLGEKKDLWYFRLDIIWDTKLSTVSFWCLFFHRLGVPDCRRSAWPNKQTTYVHISWYIKWLYDYFIISTVGALTVTTV